MSGPRQQAHPKAFTFEDFDMFLVPRVPKISRQLVDLRGWAPTPHGRLPATACSTTGAGTCHGVPMDTDGQTQTIVINTS